MLVIPVGLAFYLSRKFNLGWRLWWIGGVTFILSQVGHIPFNLALTYLFQEGILPQPSGNYALLFNSVILGLSAGLWESMARYASFRWWAKDARNWMKGIFVGAGHGGVESIILGCLVLANFVSMIVARNMELNTLVSPEQIESAQAQLSAYWDLPWYFPLIGVMERVFTMIVHISLSLMVMQVFTRRKLFWLFLAIIWHSFLDGVAVYASQTLDPIVTEVVIGSFAVVSLGIIFALRQSEQDVEEWITYDNPYSDPTGEMLTDIEENSDNLDRSRFI